LQGGAAWFLGTKYIRKGSAILILLGSIFWSLAGHKACDFTITTSGKPLATGIRERTQEQARRIVEALGLVSSPLFP